ncbi:MAG: aldehyde ferredoxin oxidoreductase family protein [Caldilineaceae bacterium]|nr:aldehyde ferredoxin oxidoreductase family protein [Caldilineaceae bacterium]
MPYGYHGKILHVDLSAQRTWIEEPDAAFYRHYMGGTNFGLHYILNGMAADADPLGPENMLTIMLSPLTGAPFSGQSRMCVNARSPLTGAIGDSQAGGFFPAELKFAGFDGLVITGQAQAPCYLWLHDGQAELRPADHLWGLGAWATETRLREELGDDKVEVACVGPAGERLVRFAAIMNMRNRAAGRTGMGAVMGAKRLKAIAVRGRRRPELADAEGVKAIARLGGKESRANGDMDELGKFGTAGVVLGQEFSGGLPTRNYQSGTFAQAEAISGERMAETILVGRDTCYACVVRCKREVEVDADGIRVHKELGGPEYETIATFGSYCEVDDLNAIAKANALCNDYGLDSISAGATIAWAMECFEAGLLTLEQADGVALRFGDAQAMLQALEALAFRNGALGELLAEGSARAAAQLGPEAQARVVAVKGSELPAHMPQVKRSMGLAYAVNPFGADHQSSEHDTSYEENSGPVSLGRLAELGLTRPVAATDLGEEKVEFTLLTQYWVSLMDVLCLCQFDWGATWQLYGPSAAADVVKAVTGWDVDLNELMTMGARRVNLLKLFNQRAGFTRADDKLPPRLYEPLTGGISDGMVFTRDELEQAKDRYYALAGWDVATGNPTPERLRELGLDNFAE